jgi:uncharacterized protein GlcG (DUF336 family)
MTALTLQQASCIVDAALAHARALGLQPLTVAVLDPGGHLMSFKREDGSGILRPEISQGKAWGALGMGVGSRSLATRAAAAPGFFAAIASTSGGRLIPVPGGVLVRDVSGSLIGAVGISGDLPDKDEACAVAGIERAGLIPDAGQASH